MAIIIPKASEINILYSGLEIDYAESYDCDSAGCDDICRCSTIDGTTLVIEDLDAIVETIIQNINEKQKQAAREKTKKLRKEAKSKGISPKTIPSVKAELLSDKQKETLSKIIEGQELTENDFEVAVCGGYYGEELDGIYFDISRWDTIKKELKAKL